tara:strand:- start:989 stop:1936 length:948 start_codon:yes stop_codon:yes gene_type:complete
MDIKLDSDSIREILTEIGYSLSDQGKYFRTKPIYRDSSSNTVLSIRKSDGKWKDFREDIGGSFEDLIRLSLSLKSKGDTTKWLINKGVDTTSEARKIEPKIPQAKIFENKSLNKLMPDHSYWNNRGISNDTLATFKGGVTENGKMANRYVFPIFNKKEQVVGFSGRDLKPERKESSEFVRPKWKHIGDKSKWNYPLLNNVKIIREQKFIIIVESIGDMLSLWENDIKNTIVSFGVILSSSMLSTLTRMDPDKIFVSFNDDSSNSSAGNEAARVAKKKLLQFFDEDQITIKLPQGHNDFNEMHLKEPSLIKNFFNG